MSEKNMDRDWYKELFNLMDEKLRGPDAYLDFKENKVDFITFNYDRSLEYFLCHSITETVDAQAAGMVTSNISRTLRRENKGGMGSLLLVRGADYGIVDRLISIDVIFFPESNHAKQAGCTATPTSKFCRGQDCTEQLE
jgi:hypothetical protein